MTTFCDRLKIAMALRTAADVAESARIPLKRIYRLRNGDSERGPTLDEIEQLAPVLRRSPEWLAFGVGR